MTIGILGGGQLGRMLALAGIPLGMRFRFLDPDPNSPARALGEFIEAPYTDETALASLIRGVHAVTYEFENVPAAAARFLEGRIPVFPPQHALAVAQDRIAEKSLFKELGIPTPRHQAADRLDELEAAVARVGIPCVVKTRRLGYDGKGQYVVRAAGEVLRAWNRLGLGRDPGDLVVEGFVPFQRELSMIGVRARDGATAFYPPVENIHTSGILVRSTAPAPDRDDRTRRVLEDAVGSLMRSLNYVGVLTVEFFDLGAGAGVAGPGERILASEMAPRVHNSGHWTIEGAECSQFENHLRAVSGLPLGPTAPRGHSIMLNIIGAEPDLPALLAMPGVHVHMYGKSPRPGRKLGHATICADNSDQAAQVAAGAARRLRNC